MYPKTFLVIFFFIMYGTSFASADEMKAANDIDQLITDQLKEKNLKANPKISDQTFLRRVYLDIVGRIPTAIEYSKFMSSDPSTRRVKTVDHLFNSQGYVSHSFNYWADTLRVTDFMKKSTGAPYKHWLKKSLEANQPYDKFVHEMLTAEGALFKPGNGAVGYYYRDFAMPLDNMSNTMQVFLATSMVCAQCHDHPYKKWSQMDFYKLAAFANGTFVNQKHLDTGFTKGVKKSGLKTNISDKTKSFRGYYQGTYNSGFGKIKLPADYDYEDAKPNDIIEAGVPFGPQVKINYDSDNGARKRIYSFKGDKHNQGKNVNGRKFLADWVTSPENPMFTKTIVNRLWDRMIGAPLVGNLTDMKESHLGVNPKLTEYLLTLMKTIKYDQKKFMRIIAKTQTYQSASSPDVSGKYYFTGPVKKRLSAEQVWDSLLSLRNGNPDKSAVVPQYSKENMLYAAIDKMNLQEKVAYAKNSQVLLKKINKQFPGSSRRGDNNARASEWKSPARLGSTLQNFGQSRRQTIDGANTDATIPQALSLMNEELINTIKENSYLGNLLKTRSSLSAKIQLIYQAVLTREASKEELALVTRYAATVDKQEVIQDFFWALVNSQEFKARP